MSKWIVTFGQVHTHRINGYTFDKDSVAIVEAEDYKKGREIAFDLFDGIFHDFMPEEEYDERGHGQYFPRGKHPANFKEDPDDR